MKRRFVSHFCEKDPQKHVLWRSPEVEFKSEIDKPVLIQSSLYKVKNENKMDPKYFILTDSTLYYTYVEQMEEVQGALDLRWLLLEFEEPLKNPIAELGISGMII